MIGPSVGPAPVLEPAVLAAVLSDPRVQDCLWVGLMEWDLRIRQVALRPRSAAEGGIQSDGWMLRIGLGPGVRLDVETGRAGSPVDVVRFVIRPSEAPDLLRRTKYSGAKRSRQSPGRQDGQPV
jgi:hypothetical protein